MLPAMGNSLCVVLVFGVCSTLLATDFTAQMRAVRKIGLKGCTPPDFTCVATLNDTKTPNPGLGELRIKVSSSGVNPDELTILKIPAVHYTLGIDVAGIVDAKGPGTSERISIGDRVWAAGIRGGMAEFATRPEAICGVVPEGIDMVAAGTLPTVAMTSFGALRSAGAPWANNVTVLITAGTGGTGYIAVQLAKAQGANRIVTAATGDGISFAKSLGADIVVDFKKNDVYDAVPNGSLDVVISNHKSNTTAARAMPKLRVPGGVYVTLDGDTYKGKLPPGVRQVEYDLFHPTEAAQCINYLDAIGHLISSGKVHTHVQQAFRLEQAKHALQLMAQGHVMSKLAVTP